jgi:acyl carrier protein
MDLPYELEGLQGENSTLKDALKLDSIKTVRIIKHLEKI